jgi:uncharacterized RDD family membrane protein YckC
MKCAKCLYIGFETGDRCKNCGYDFTLLAMADEEPAPLDLMPAPEPTSGLIASTPSIDRFRDLPVTDGPAMTLADPAFLETPAAVPLHGDAMRDAPALPLFAPDAPDDEPLVKLPRAPRPPLSVRRTPEAPRLRTTPSFERPGYDDAVLQFSQEPEADVVPIDDVGDLDIGHTPATNVEPPARRVRPPLLRAEAVEGASPFGRRFVAAVIDHGILLGIDLVVLYFTLRLTDLTFADWRVLPWLPLAAFLLSLKVAYLSAFTTAGGQTIGKMATHIRVVSEDGGGLDAGRALRRAVLGLMSIATAGAPFLTAVADPLRRCVHDRASGTRVVAVSAR